MSRPSFAVLKTAYKTLEIPRYSDQKGAEQSDLNLLAALDVSH